MRRAEAERELRRLERLRAENLSSERDVDRAQSELAALEARFAALERAVDVAQATVRVRAQEIEDLEVRAPFAGVIVSKNAQPGEMVSPISAGGGFTRTGIATLVDMDSREIEVDVNESFINRVQAGQKTEATLDAYPDWVIPSHVINIVPTADRQKATVQGAHRLRRARSADPVEHGHQGDVPRFERRATSRARAPRRRRRDRPCACRRAPSSRDGSTSFVWRVRGERVERVAVRVGARARG